MTVTPSLIKAAYDAARIYRDLKIVCPWCRGSVFGRDFAAHAGEHEQDRGPQISAVEQDCPGGCGGKCPSSQSYCVPCFEGALFIDRNAIRLQRERADKAARRSATWKTSAKNHRHNFNEQYARAVRNGKAWSRELERADALELKFATSEAGTATMPAKGSDNGSNRERAYPLAADTLGPEEIDAAKAVLDSGKLTMGERVKQFEREFAAYVGSKHAIMVNSGSSANLLMVDAMLRSSTPQRWTPWRPGDEVIVPALAWPTTVWPLVQLGLVPVFVDVDPETLAIDLKSAQSVLSPRTRGMFLIHVLGQAAPANQYRAFCDAHRIDLLEDCCESLGAHTKESITQRHVGNFGLAGSFSFYYSHHLSTIEGGMIVTNNDALNDNFRSLRAHGWSRDRSDREEWARMNPTIDERFLFVMPGYNVRPMEIQGAIGSVQLRKLDAMIDERKLLAIDVRKLVEKRAPWLHLVGDKRLRGLFTRNHSWMTLSFIVDESAPVSRDAVCAHLRERGVDTRPIIAGNLVRHPAVGLIEHHKAESLSVADRVFERGFMIGCHPVLSDGARETLEKAIESLGDL